MLTKWVSCSTRRPHKLVNRKGGASRKKRKSLSLPNYIKKKTNDSKALTNFYIGILKAVENSDTDNVPMYKGMKVIVELPN